MNDWPVVFDLDGVIVDSARAVVAAYLEAGVVVPTDVLDHEQLPWLDDLLLPEQDADLVRSMKNRAYVRLLGNHAVAPLLAPFAVAVQLKLLKVSLHIVSRAPQGSLAALSKRSVVWPFGVSRDGLSSQEKVDELPKFGLHGVYVDDQDRSNDVPEGWEFVRYQGQSAEDLYLVLIQRLAALDRWSRLQ